MPRTEVQNRYSYWDLDATSPISVPGYNLKGVKKFVDNEYAFALRPRPEQLRPAPRLRLRAQLQDLDPRRRRHLLQTVARHGCRSHRVAVQHEFAARVHAG